MYVTLAAVRATVFHDFFSDVKAHPTAAQLPAAGPSRLRESVDSR